MRGVRKMRKLSRRSKPAFATQGADRKLGQILFTPQLIFMDGVAAIVTLKGLKCYATYRRVDNLFLHIFGTPCSVEKTVLFCFVQAPQRSCRIQSILAVTCLMSSEATGAGKKDCNKNASSSKENIEDNYFCYVISKLKSMLG